jgi:hypothetical protein
MRNVFALLGFLGTVAGLIYAVINYIVLGRSSTPLELIWIATSLCWNTAYVLRSK